MKLTNLTMGYFASVLIILFLLSSTDTNVNHGKFVTIFLCLKKEGSEIETMMLYLFPTLSLVQCLLNV